MSHRCCAASGVSGGSRSIRRRYNPRFPLVLERRDHAGRHPGLAGARGLDDGSARPCTDARVALASPRAETLTAWPSRSGCPLIMPPRSIGRCPCVIERRGTTSLLRDLARRMSGVAEPNPTPYRVIVQLPGCGLARSGSFCVRNKPPLQAHPVLEKTAR